MFLTLYSFRDMSFHGGSFISSFVKSAGISDIPNLRIASCSIVVPFLDLFVMAKNDVVSSTGGAAICSITSVVPFVPFFSPFFSISPFFSVS